jgi:hypothetical protein
MVASGVAQGTPNAYASKKRRTGENWDHINSADEDAMEVTNVPRIVSEDYTTEMGTGLDLPWNEENLERDISERLEKCSISSDSSANVDSVTMEVDNSKNCSRHDATIDLTTDSMLIEPDTPPPEYDERETCRNAETAEIVESFELIGPTEPVAPPAPITTQPAEETASPIIESFINNLIQTYGNITIKSCLAPHLIVHNSVQQQIKSKTPKSRST